MSSNTVDLREQLLQSVTYSLVDEGFSGDDIARIKNILIFTLENYEVNQRCTDLAVIDSSTEKIIKLYLGSIMSEGVRKTSAKAYYDFLRRFYNDIQKPLTEVNTYDIRLWIASVKDNLSDRTIHTYCNYISAFYNWLTKEEIIAKNPYGKIKTPKVKKKVKMPFSETDIDKMRFSCKNLRERAMLELLLSSGIRVSELCAMNINDIDLVKKRVTVYNGKGGKQRVTYMSDVAAECLNKYIMSRSDNTECLFYSRSNKNNHRVTSRTIERDLKAIGNKAGVDNAHPHKCRRTFATTLYHRGADLKTIQALMGHDNIETTMGYISSYNEYAEYNYRKCS